MSPRCVFQHRCTHRRWRHRDQIHNLFRNTRRRKHNTVGVDGVRKGRVIRVQLVETCQIGVTPPAIPIPLIYLAVKAGFGKLTSRAFNGLTRTATATCSCDESISIVSDEMRCGITEIMPPEFETRVGSTAGIRHVGCRTMTQIPFQCCVIVCTHCEPSGKLPFRHRSEPFPL